MGQQSFDAEQLRAMGVAFEHVCQSLGLRDTGDGFIEIVATKVIETAKTGESDPVRLYEAVMRWASAA